MESKQFAAITKLPESVPKDEASRFMHEVIEIEAELHVGVDFPGMKFDSIHDVMIYGPFPIPDEGFVNWLAWGEVHLEGNEDDTRNARMRDNEAVSGNAGEHKACV